MLPRLSLATAFSFNIRAVDEMSNLVLKFDSEGRVAMHLGRKAEAEFIPPRTPAGDGAGQSTDLGIISGCDRPVAYNVPFARINHATMSTTSKSVRRRFDSRMTLPLGSTIPEEPCEMRSRFAPATSARITQTRFSTALARSEALASWTSSG